LVARNAVAIEPSLDPQLASEPYPAARKSANSSFTGA